MVTLLLAAALATATSSPSATPPAEVALIEQSASTNRAAYAIALSRDGEATVTAGDTSRTMTLDRVLSQQLYADLERIPKLAALATGSCMKSASFGTVTTVSYRGERTPDLQCAQDALGRTLSADVEAIAGSAMALLPPARRQTQPIGRRLPTPPQ